MSHRGMMRAECTPTQSITGRINSSEHQQVSGFLVCVCVCMCVCTHSGCSGEKTVISPDWIRVHKQTQRRVKNTKKSKQPITKHWNVQQRVLKWSWNMNDTIRESDVLLFSFSSQTDRQKSVHRQTDRQTFCHDDARWLTNCKHYQPTLSQLVVKDD